MFDRRPLAVLKAEQVGDVIAAVNFAREHGLDLSVRGGGHSGPGFGTNDGGLVIDMSQMRTVRVDPTEQDGPCRCRRDLGRLQLRDARVRPGDDRRDHLDHRHLRSDAGRRHRLPRPRARADDRQPDLGRRGHRRREVPHRERARERGSLLGAARRRRQLRRRDVARVSPRTRSTRSSPARSSTTWKTPPPCFGCSTSSSGTRPRSSAGSPGSRSPRRCRSSRRTGTATPCAWWWCTGPARSTRPRAS